MPTTSSRANLETVSMDKITALLRRPRSTYICFSVTFPEEVRAGQTSLISRFFKQVMSLLLFLFILE